MSFIVKKKLQFLDATPISAAERKEGEKRGAFLQIARPKNEPKSPEPAPKPAEKRKEVKEHTPKVGAFLARGKARYDGSNSEGNRFIKDDDL